MYISTPFAHVVALDAETGKEIWRYKHVRKQKRLCCGPANRGVAIGYGLVFTGEGNGNFSAFDAENRKRLWTFNCGPGVNASPVTFAIDGKQYISVAAGGSKIWGFPTGDKVYVFEIAE